MKKNIILDNTDEVAWNDFKNEVYPNEYKTIYHYTGLKTLQNLISKKQFLLTNVEFLNDYTEFEHGLKRFTRYAREEDNFWNKFLNFKDKVYIGSFCYTGNDLSLWRLYADNAKGVAVGFNVKKLTKFLKEKEKDLFFLLGKCIYRENDKKILVKKYSDKNFTGAKFGLITSLFKNFHFKAEKEIRLAIIHISKKTKFISYGFSQDLYKRFYILDLNERLFDYISEIVIGPAGDQIVIERSIKLMFEEREQKCCKITKSKIPYRLI